MKLHAFGILALFLLIAACSDSTPPPAATPEAPTAQTETDKQPAFEDSRQLIYEQLGDMERMQQFSMFSPQMATSKMAVPPPPGVKVDRKPGDTAIKTTEYETRLENPLTAIHGVWLGELTPGPEIDGFDVPTLKKVKVSVLSREGKRRSNDPEPNAWEKNYPRPWSLENAAREAFEAAMKTPEKAAENDPPEKAKPRRGEVRHPQSIVLEETFTLDPSKKVQFLRLPKPVRCHLNPGDELMLVVEYLDPERHPRMGYYDLGQAGLIVLETEMQRSLPSEILPRQAAEASACFMRKSKALLALYSSGGAEAYLRKPYAKLSHTGTWWQKDRQWLLDLRSDRRPVTVAMDSETPLDFGIYGKGWKIVDPATDPRCAPFVDVERGLKTEDAEAQPNVTKLWLTQVLPGGLPEAAVRLSSGEVAILTRTDLYSTFLEIHRLPAGADDAVKLFWTPLRKSAQIAIRAAGTDYWKVHYFNAPLKEWSYYNRKTVPWKPWETPYVVPGPPPVEPVPEAPSVPAPAAPASP